MLLHPPMRQSLSCLKLEVLPQAILQKLAEIVLLAWGLLDQQLQVITDTAPRKHAHALGHDNPRALYPPSLQEGGQSRHDNASSGCKPFGVCRNAPGSTPQRCVVAEEFPLSASLATWWRASPRGRRRRSSKSRALPRSTPERGLLVNLLSRLPRSTPEHRLLANLLSQSCLASFDHVSAVLVVVEHLPARREVCFFIHGAHLRVRGCIMLQPLPRRQIRLQFASIWFSEGGVQAHLGRRHEGMLPLEGSSSAL